MLAAVEAAFFDLDKTVIAKASMVAFGRPLYRAGLISRWILLRAVWGQLVYLQLGADEDRLLRVRQSVLRLAKGWDQARVCEIVRETMDEVIEPIVYDEAIELIRAHRDAGRRVVIVSASPTRDRGAAGAIPGCARRDRHAGRARRRRSLHRRGRVLLVRRVQGGGDARARASFTASTSHRPMRTPTR